MSNNKISSKSAGAGLLVAITASLCCITPVLALISGVSGIAASFSWLEPIRPFLIGITVLVLGFAWYQKLKPKKEDIDCACEVEEKEPFMQSKFFLGIVTIFAAIMLAFPYYSSIFYPTIHKQVVVTTPTEVKQIKLEIKGMTCTSCEESINHAAMGVAGVIKATSDYKSGKATISYNGATSSQQDIINAIDATGYTVVSTQAVTSSEMPIINIGNNQNMKEIVLPVAGMTCTGCEDHIDYEVSKLNGVSGVRASYEKGNTIVKYDPSKTTKKDIVAAINATGYTVEEPNNSAGN